MFVARATQVLSLALPRASSVVVALSLLAACGSGAPVASAPPAASRSEAPAASALAGPTSCEAHTSCESCAADPSCRFCTAPRGCISAGTSCGGLALADASTCTNDPEVGGSQRARAIATLRSGLLAHLRDMPPAGPAIEARLEGLSSISVPIPAQRCYSLVWSIAEDAVLADATVQLDFVGPKGSQGGMITPLVPAGWSGRACTSVAGSLVVTVVDSESYSRLVPAGRGKIAFALHARPRTPADSDEGAGPPVVATQPAGPTRPAPSPGSERGPRGSVGVDCQDCTFPCESSVRDCERRCFVDEREMPGRRACERVCEQIGRACLRGCPGCN